VEPPDGGIHRAAHLGCRASPGASSRHAWSRVASPAPGSGPASHTAASDQFLFSGARRRERSAWRKSWARAAPPPAAARIRLNTPGRRPIDRGAAGTRGGPVLMERGTQSSRSGNEAGSPVTVRLERAAISFQGQFKFIAVGRAAAGCLPGGRVVADHRSSTSLGRAARARYTIPPGARHVSSSGDQPELETARTTKPSRPPDASSHRQQQGQGSWRRPAGEAKQAPFRIAGSALAKPVVAATD